MKCLCIGLYSGMIACALSPSFAATATPQTEKVIYSFCAQQNCADGRGPYAGLLDLKGKLYGTTNWGGSNYNNCGAGSCGTVFEFDSKGDAEKVLYSFCGQQSCSDGESPTTSLIAAGGKLYGTTDIGGAGSLDCEGTACGTVFSLDPDTGAETVLHSFCSQQNCSDGAQPNSGLINVAGALYGTTADGGANTFYSGTVFRIDRKTGSESVLYSFCSEQNCEDGASPQANLIDVHGVLYGTTYDGGASDGGTVFAVDPETGAENVVYSFCSKQNCTDGGYPVAGLINEKHILFGTTDRGGIDDDGAVFALDLNTGVEKVIYSFCSRQSCTDGAYPESGLIDIKGTLYGTTYGGGSEGEGTVYALDPKTGLETVLYSFCSQQNCADGAYPGFANLIEVKGALYGTTLQGGSGANCLVGGGCGTIFAVQP